MAAIAAVFVLVTALGAALLLPAAGSPEEVLAAALYAVAFGSEGAGLACFVAEWPRVRSLRTEASPDVTTQRVISRLVVRGRGDGLDADDRRVAARWSAVYAALMPFQLAIITLLLGGNGLQLIASIIGHTGRSGDLSTVVLVFSLAVLPALVVVLLLQWRRVRRYADEHAHERQPAPGTD